MADIWPEFFSGPIFNYSFQQCSQQRGSLNFISSLQCKYMNFIYLKSSFKHLSFQNFLYKKCMQTVRRIDFEILEMKGFKVKFCSHGKNQLGSRKSPEKPLKFVSEKGQEPYIHVGSNCVILSQLHVPIVPQYFFFKIFIYFKVFFIQLLNEKRKQTKVEEKSPKNEEDKKLPTKSKVRKNLRKAQKTLTSPI